MQPNPNVCNHHQVELNDTHHSGLIHWAGGGSQLVICLTRDMVVRPGHPSSVYVSLDHGRSFTNISANFSLEDGSPAVIGHSYEHPEFNNIVSTGAPEFTNIMRTVLPDRGIRQNF